MELKFKALGRGAEMKTQDAQPSLTVCLSLNAWCRINLATLFTGCGTALLITSFEQRKDVQEQATSPEYQELNAIPKFYM